MYLGVESFPYIKVTLSRVLAMKQADDVRSVELKCVIACHVTYPCCRFSSFTFLICHVRRNTFLCVRPTIKRSRPLFNPASATLNYNYPHPLLQFRLGSSIGSFIKAATSSKNQLALRYHSSEMAPSVHSATQSPSMEHYLSMVSTSASNMQANATALLYTTELRENIMEHLDPLTLLNLISTCEYFSEIYLHRLVATCLNRAAILWRYASFQLT